MDKTILSTKHFDLYLSTLQVGFGILYVPEHKSLHIHLAVFELAICCGVIK